MGQHTDIHAPPRFLTLLALAIIPVIALTLLVGPSTQCNAAQSESNVVIYFYSPGCSECLHAERMLTKLEENHPNLKIQAYNMFEPGIMEMREEFDRAYDVPLARRGAVPAVFVGQSWFIGAKEVEIATDEGWLPDASYEVSIKPLNPDKDAITQRFASFDLGVVLGAGLIDGINPCAFAGLSFLISYLLMSGSSRKHLLYTGLGFCGAMFITYLAIGTGILSIVKRTQVISWIMPLLNGIVGLLAVILGVLSFIDALGAVINPEKTEFTLGLPKRISRSIRTTIRKYSNPGALLVGAITTGFLVSAMEFLCTGQVYLPTIVYVHSVYPGNPRAILYLIAYNLAFMVPAVGVFVAAYFGMGSRVLARLAAKSMVTVKFLTGLLFLLLGTYLLKTLW